MTETDPDRHRPLPTPYPTWPHFPHCRHCHERCWATTTYRHPQDPRGPLRLPESPEWRCPHCGRPLYGDTTGGRTA